MFRTVLCAFALVAASLLFIKPVQADNPENCGAALNYKKECFSYTLTYDNGLVRDFQNYGPKQSDADAHYKNTYCPGAPNLIKVVRKVDGTVICDKKKQ